MTRNRTARELRNASSQIQDALTTEASLSRASCFAAADLMERAADEIDALDKKANIYVRLPRGLRWLANS